MRRASESVADDHDTAVRGCLEACRRCQALVERVSRSPRAEAAYAAIGPHLRHCIDHFDCLWQGVDRGVVDYDARARSRELEREPGRFDDAMRRVSSWLRGLEPSAIRRALRVKQVAAAGGAVVEVDSNLERELVFLSGHTIHHLAIMKLLAEAQGVLVPESLDIAYSTEAYLERAD